MKLYEKSDTNIWSDSYIGKKMLGAHLDVESDAASRKADVINATINWILHPYDFPKTAIDLGCGPGLYTTKFSSRGWQVLGVDINKYSVEHANQESIARKLSAQHIEGSYLSPLNVGTFDLATCIYCDFGALVADDQQLFLRNVRMLLNKDGVLVLDVFGKGVSDTKTEGRYWNSEAAGNFWCNQPCYVLSECVHFHESHVWGEKHIIIPKSGKPFSTVIWTHYFTTDKITALLEKFGFEVLEINTDIVKKSDFISSDVIFVRARKI
ncbi:MAG: methyltransferase domain-containing protein [Campylobacterales bacterium]|nr:methyltransferase domain-containing protein [Campylobacterales bacterium]